MSFWKFMYYACGVWIHRMIRFISKVAVTIQTAQTYLRHALWIKKILVMCLKNIKVVQSQVMLQKSHSILFIGLEYSGI